MIGDLELREVGSEDDLRFLMELRNQNLEFYIDQAPLDWTTQLRWWQKVKNDRCNRYLVVWYQGERVGIGRLHQISPESVGIGGDIRQDFRGRGLGRRLFETLVLLCQNSFNPKVIWLEVLVDNVRATNLYFSLGFREVERDANIIRMELRSSSGKWM